MVTTLQLQQEVSDWSTRNHNKGSFYDSWNGETLPRVSNMITDPLTEDEDDEREAVQRARLRLNADTDFGSTVVLARHRSASTRAAAHRTATRGCDSRAESNVYCASIIITSANITVDRIKTKSSSKNNNNNKQTVLNCTSQSVVSFARSSVDN